MNFFEEPFDLLNLFQVVDSPPRMDGILSSSTVKESADTISNRPPFDHIACENKHRASVCRSISLMQPKPKFVFIPTPSYTPLATGISMPTTVASQNDANNMTITGSAVDRSVSHKSSLVGSRSNYSNTMLKFESAVVDDLQNTAPLVSWLNLKIKPKKEPACGFLQYNAPWNSTQFETMKQKWPKIEAGYDFQGNTTPWNSVPVINWKRKQPKIKPAYGAVEYNTPSPWNSVPVQNVKKKKPKMEPAHDFKYNTSVQNDHRCTICGAAFPSPQSLGGHMSAHVRKNKQITPNNYGTVKETNQTKKRCKREY